MRISRAELYRRIAALPAADQEEAVRLALQVYGAKKVGLAPRPDGLTRDVEQRRALAGDPWKYFRDVFGYSLTPQQERAVDDIERFDRVLIPSGNNLGKTWLLGAYGVYRMDAVAAVPDEENGLEERGARVLLPGPDHKTIFGTIYSKMLVHAERAERRGFLMPGYRSDKTVLWRVRPEWEVEAFSPPKKVGETLAHQAAGRHHVNQIALVEEGQGVVEPLWLSCEGMCSASGNKIISSFNPGEAGGPAFQRAQSGGWKVIHLSAFDHPNIRTRSIAIAGAVAPLVVDERVRRRCSDRGPFPDVKPDVKMRDFVYAIPVLGAEEKGPRKDGYLGHPDGKLRVYRPDPVFEATVLGQWPTTTDLRLFTFETYRRAVERHAAAPDPKKHPDRVGGDLAREGVDETVAAPAWGPPAEAVLRAYLDALQEDEGREGTEAVDLVRATMRIRIGRLQVLPKGDGPDTANALLSLWPSSPFVLDVAGVGASCYDHLVRVIGATATGVSFGGSPPDPVPGEELSENMRTALYVRAAWLVALDLVDLPDDPLLWEELRECYLLHRYRSVDVIDPMTRKERKDKKPSVLLVEKDEIKARIGRSPDRADAFVLALADPAARRRKGVFLA